VNKFTEQAKAKGWSMKAIGDRWGVTQRQMSNIGASPKQVHWDALAGLPDLKE